MTLDRAIAFGSPKEAALYFDRVFPFDMSTAAWDALGIKPAIKIPDGLPFDLERGHNRKLLDSLLRDAKGVELYLDQFTLSFAMFLVHRANNQREEFEAEVARGGFNGIDSLGWEEKYGLKLEQLLLEVAAGKVSFKTAQDRLGKVVTSTPLKAGFGNAPTWHAAWWSDLKSNDTNKPSSIEMVLSGLDLISVDEVSWEQVIELREDSRSMKELRDFRLFLTETFTEDQDPNYIRDKLLSLHDQSLEAARRWGIKSRSKVLSVVLDQSTAIATAAASVPLILAGGPLAGLASLCLPVGKAIIEFKSVSVEADEDLSKSSLRYLSRVKDLAG